MSTVNNSEQLFDNSVKILTDLIGFKTISGEDNSSLIDYCDDILKKLGATSFRTYDDEKKRINLFATLKAKNPQTKKTNNSIRPHRCSSCFKRMEFRSFHGYH